MFCWFWCAAFASEEEVEFKVASVTTDPPFVSASASFRAAGDEGGGGAVVDLGMLTVLTRPELSLKEATPCCPIIGSGTRVASAGGLLPTMVSKIFSALLRKCSLLSSTSASAGIGVEVAGIFGDGVDVDRSACTGAGVAVVVFTLSLLLERVNKSRNKVEIPPPRAELLPVGVGGLVPGSLVLPFPLS